MAGSSFRRAPQQIELQLLRHGETYNQLLSPLTDYMAICGDHPTATVNIPLKHRALLTRLRALDYKDTSETRDDQLDELSAVVSNIFADFPGLSTELSRCDDCLAHVSLATSAAELAMVPFELAMMHAIFRGRDQVQMQDLKNTFAADLAATQRSLYDDVTARGWFRGNPQSVRRGYQVLGMALCALAFFLVFFAGLASINAAVLAVGLLGGGVVVLALAGRMPARTASGSAVLAQAEGFRLYLTTAEADQIRFEEGQDLFSRYLPYAIVFGVAERWAKVFDELARQGAAVSAPSWYVGHAPTWSYLALGHSLGSFEATANSALVSTPAASGGSYY